MAHAKLVCLTSFALISIFLVACSSGDDKETDLASTGEASTTLGITASDDQIPEGCEMWCPTANECCDDWDQPGDKGGAPLPTSGATEGATEGSTTGDEAIVCTCPDFEDDCELFTICISLGGTFPEGCGQADVLTTCWTDGCGCPPDTLSPDTDECDDFITCLGLGGDVPDDCESCIGDPEPEPDPPTEVCPVINCPDKPPCNECNAETPTCDKIKQARYYAEAHCTFGTDNCSSTAATGKPTYGPKKWVVNFSHYKKKFKQPKFTERALTVTGVTLAVGGLIIKKIEDVYCPDGLPLPKELKFCGKALGVVSAAVGAITAITKVYEVHVELNTNDCELEKVYTRRVDNLVVHSLGKSICRLPPDGSMCDPGGNADCIPEANPIGEEEVKILVNEDGGIDQHRETDMEGCVAFEQYNSACGKPFWDQSGACMTCSCGGGQITNRWYAYSWGLNWDAHEACRIEACSKWGDVQVF
jgi:hypothetical protein